MKLATQNMILEFEIVTVVESQRRDNPVKMLSQWKHRILLSTHSARQIEY